MEANICDVEVDVIAAIVRRAAIYCSHGIALLRRSHNTSAHFVFNEARNVAGANGRPFAKLVSFTVIF